MNRPGQHGQPGRVPSVWRELERPIAAPDLTGPVMRRLGLGGLTPAQVAGRRALRAAARLALCIAVAGGSALLVRTYLVLTAPPAAGPTIPSAIRNDLEHHGRTINGAIRTFRELGATQVSAAASVPTDTSPAEDDSTIEQEAAQPPA